MPQNRALTDRVRAALSPYEQVREVSMFGGLAFLVDDRMVVSVRDDDLLVRADPARADQLLTVEGARTAEMGAGRAMSKSWISVSEQALATDEALTVWMAVALGHHTQQRRDNKQGRAGQARGKRSPSA